MMKKWDMKIVQTPTSTQTHFPLSCVLDILRHLPHCAFSERQNTAIHWAMRILGLHYIPSQRTMKDVERALQQLCGVDSIQYSGALGHVYYVNDFAWLVAQELANPLVRQHLRFLPEDSRARLSEAWQAKRWLEELDPELLTQMICVNTQDFFVYEPALLKDRRVCMPVCWFTRGGSTFAWAYSMSATLRGWIVHEQLVCEIHSDQLLLSFPQLTHSHSYHALPDPRVICGAQKMDVGPVEAWTKTNPIEGNKWRVKAHGHRVMAFPIWLYCDDTSGNVSKKWNKHNSFLFTVAGLPCRLVHREFNVHFLSTSNIAPPLEMLDGIVEQLKQCQTDGRNVLVLPSVLAMLGDNPMQSEIACHIGLMGKLFCRACWVKNNAGDENQEPRAPEIHSQQAELSGDLTDDRESDASSMESTLSDNTRMRRKAPETLAHMIKRVKCFMEKGHLCTKSETQCILASQFDSAQEIGGQTSFKQQRTNTGIKDTFQGFFADKLFRISTKRGTSRVQKEVAMGIASAAFPDDTTSPVWRIKDFNPHSDTPVEILHVILLGFVKYLWRDAISRLKDPQKAVLIARLNSFNVSGLGISKLAGLTLVTYSGSLTGRDFHAIAQAAPFVLHDLLSSDALAVWQALGILVPLVWKPEIEDIDAYLLQRSIDYFLDCTCRLTPCWFNKPKFHIILHLPEHIRRFGPAMLFATEGFDVLSNRHAPSRDIAQSMAGSNCDVYGSPWIRMMKSRRIAHWRGIGATPRELLEDYQFAKQLLGFPAPDETDSHTQTAALVNGDHCKPGDWVVWLETHLTEPRVTYSRVGLVMEILQITGSLAERNGKADLILIKHAIVGDLSVEYDMPCVSVLDEYVLSEASVVCCTVNVQHNCMKNHCRVTRSQPVYQERELTTQQANAVQHLNVCDCVLNTAQMRDASKIDPFRIPIPRLDRDTIIHAAAIQELEAAKLCHQVQPNGKAGRQWKPTHSSCAVNEHRPAESHSQIVCKASPLARRMQALIFIIHRSHPPHK
ncbi:hypothetical protein NEOLEDRAFT_1156913 [Neolentinus lepideus HHB14362 ss-1]|uniref:Uncharacterized protein n=1 Tax=Neolentinus lepideus HHB14362 ss-1 TaxID=1314782 RepID=A0A165RYA2_9AGAM|nr:hypothetical protein NEOLEDRAFT_1156913 [Neolentinus lepideus HHB14362 ss-1]